MTGAGLRAFNPITASLPRIECMHGCFYYYLVGKCQRQSFCLVW